MLELHCRHWNTDQKEDGTLEVQRRDGGTNSTLRTKEQGRHLTLNEHDDDDDDEIWMVKIFLSFSWQSLSSDSRLPSYLWRYVSSLCPKVGSSGSSVVLLNIAIKIPNSVHYIRKPFTLSKIELILYWSIYFRLFITWGIRNAIKKLGKSKFNTNNNFIISLRI